MLLTLIYTFIMGNTVDQTISKLHQVASFEIHGFVTKVQGIMLEASGINHGASVGTRCKILLKNRSEVLGEVVGLNEKSALLMPFANVDGIGIGCKVVIDKDQNSIYPSELWKGRIINALGEPIDDKGPLPQGNTAYAMKSPPPSAHKRSLVEGKIDLGVKAINTFLTCCLGQRMGIFAGSGIGKSMLIAMLTKFSQADIKIIGLIGERGRELQEFVHEYLGEEGLKNAIIIAATSDESAMMRRQAAYTTMAVAEYFRDQGMNALCMMDSVTRFAMAQREIGLSAGEPPTSKGYTPTVFVELPQLLERAGPGIGQGSITGLFTVLVEGDDHNEPVSDAVRGILDGHIVLEREIAERGRFPAINILRSVSRTMPGCNTEEQNKLVTIARKYLAAYEDMADMIRLGAYRKGTDPVVDEAMYYYPKLEEFLAQSGNEKYTLEECYAQLATILQPPAQPNDQEAQR